MHFFAVFHLLFFLAVVMKTETDDMIPEVQRGSIKKRWIRKDFDADGYFLLQLWERKGANTKLFLTAEDAFSLTIQGM